jgi:mRNA-degrading endonuclease HigB of HigAB toxin-antitoxin module
MSGMETKTKTQMENETARFRALFETVEDKANWKNPTRIKRCASRAEAQELADAITFFVGGAEINHDNVVVSRGYYFYCGA